MKIYELEDHINRYIDCVDFRSPENSAPTHDPNLNPFEEVSFTVLLHTFRKPEKVLCKMLLDKIIYQMHCKIGLHNALINKGVEMDRIKLYWRIKPEIELKDHRFLSIYARYSIS